MWVVDGTDEARLVKMDAKTGSHARDHSTRGRRSRSARPRDADGKLYFCDAGIHPGWDRDKSPHTGWVCRVDVLR